MPVSDNNPGPDEGFSVYIHWPFCGSMCPYCDFNSHVRSGIDTAAWEAGVDALDHALGQARADSAGIGPLEALLSAWNRD